MTHSPRARQHAPSEPRTVEDDAAEKASEQDRLDEALEESFPASDPIAVD
jgi:hypothetical protein